MDKTPWSVPVAMEDIPDTGLHLDIEAPAPARKGVAELAGLRELPKLAAVFDLMRQGARVHVAGRVTAVVGQTCVVSLEPVENQVDEAVDVTYAPPGSVGPNADDPPEPLINGSLDVGGLATEFLLLAIDPYPRKAGVTFVAPKAEEAGERPFAALKTLKQRFGGNS